MKFFRKRWWGAYVMMPIFLYAGLVFSGISTAFFMDDEPVKGALSGVLALFIFGCVLLMYAPYYFHNLGRMIAMAIFVVFLLYFIEMIRSGTWLGTGKRSESNALNAFFGLAIIGTPCLLYAITNKKPDKNPYRSDGSERKPLRSELRSDDEFYFDEGLVDESEQFHRRD